MKKLFLILVAVIGFGFCAKAQKSMWQVTVTIQKTYHYFNDDGKEVGTRREPALPYVDNYCAQTAEQAKDQAKADCQGICARDAYYPEGQQRYTDGKLYNVKSTKEVSDANAKLLNQSCN